MSTPATAPASRRLRVRLWVSGILVSIMAAAWLIGHAQPTDNQSLAAGIFLQALVLLVLFWIGVGIWTAIRAITRALAREAKDV